jgi:glucokinase
MKYFSGIDLGGTKVYSVIINEKGKILGRAKVKIKSKNYESILNKIIDCYKESVYKSGINELEVKKIGIAVPSPVNIKKGIMLMAPNLGLKNIKLKDDLEKRLKINVFLDNDANMGTYGEYSLLKEKKYNDVYGVFIGTGIGGGYIKDSDIVRGHNFTAGEIGHMIIQIDGPKCNCGNYGCLEAIASKTGIIKTIMKLQYETGKKSMINEIYPDWQNGVNSSSLKKCYKANDEIVIEAVKIASKAIGIAMANIINLIGVDAIILGGGLYESLYKEMTPIIEKYMIKYSISAGANGVKLLKSRLGDDAVSYGAARFVSM